VLWYESGELVGFAGMNSYSDPSEVEATILVHPEFRRRGIGRQMVMAIVRGLQNSGGKRITIEVETENQNTLSLYQRCGFVTVNATDYELLELPRIPTAPELLFDR
jgi:ribosomal-protein-alanine N-acetyltransferase